MNSMRLRLLGPLWLFGFLPAIGAAKLMGHSLDWFFGMTGVLLGGGVFLLAYLLSGWVLSPTRAVMSASSRILKGLPPTHEDTSWLPEEYAQLRTEINTLFAKQHHALQAAEDHASQVGQRLIHAERLAREAYAAMQSLFAASHEGMAVVDSRGTILASNEKLDQMLQQTVDQAMGRDGDALVALLKSRLNANVNLDEWFTEVVREPEQVHLVEGTLNVEPPMAVVLECLPMRSESGALMGRLFILHDHSKWSRMEQQLRESQKMGTLGLIAGGIAHDFNNLLTAIQGNLALAEVTPLDRPQDVKDRLDGASQATAKAAELVKQLLGYSRRGPLEKQPVDMKKVITDVQSLLRHSVDPRIQVSTRIGVDESWVKADVVQLEQVLLNLGVNARDALPENGGCIEISLNNASRSDEGIGETDSLPFVLISVRDNGCGIDAENQHRIFEAFFTTKEANKGTGLGLATAQEIIQAHGGWIEFESEVGRGTEFRIYLPRVAAVFSPIIHTEDPEPAPAPSAGVAELNRRRVLVVDDEAPVRAIAVNMLTFLGYDVVEAQDGQEALDRMETEGNHIDAILLDIYMPRLSGRDTFRSLRASGNNIPVVICSGFSLDPNEFAVLSQGGAQPVDLMIKPYSLKSLKTALERALGSVEATAEPLALELAAS